MYTATASGATLNNRAIRIVNPDLDAILRLSEGVYFGCDYLPHALESWLGEEERSPGGKRRNLSLVEMASGRTVGYQERDSIH